MNDQDPRWEYQVANYQTLHKISYWFLTFVFDTTQVGSLYWPHNESRPSAEIETKKCFFDINNK